MKSKLVLFYLLVCLLWLVSCQKDTDIFTPNNNLGSGLDTLWVNNVTDLSPITLLKRSLNKEITLDSLEITAGGTLLTREGLTIIFQQQSLLFPNGLPVTGKIYVESFLIKQKGDMVRMDKPTTSNGRILISGGEIFIRLRKENEELHLAPGKNIYLKYADAPPSPLMKIFLGDESNPERFNWLPSIDSSQNNFLRTTTDGYEMSINKLRWINSDYFADTTGQRIRISTSLPPDYINANTAVYLIFKEQRTVMAIHGDFNTRKFSVANIPTGKQVIIVSITKKGNNSYYLGHELITTGSNGTVSGGQIIPLSPQPTSLPDIKSYLSTL